jgi:hypothetical protein
MPISAGFCPAPAKASFKPARQGTMPEWVCFQEHALDEGFRHAK